VKTGAIFCFECHDFIHHSKVDELYLAATVTAEEQQTRFQGSSFFEEKRVLIMCAVAKKPRERFQSWAPTAQDVAALENSVTIPCQVAQPKWCAYRYWNSR
jgi:ubiquitin carboxyl-terminal hydrolase 22/27/51